MAVLFLGVLAVASLGAHDHDDRVVTGRVLVEAPSSDVARCAWLMRGHASQGLLGWVVPIRDHERDGLHAYELRSHGGVGDLDVVFYADLGNCASGAEPIGDVVGLGYPPLIDNDHDGWVPRQARYAVIGKWGSPVGCCHYGGTVVWPDRSGSGVAVPFTFTIGHDPAPETWS